MPQIRVVVQSKEVPAEPDKTGCFAGCPQISRKTFLRRMDLGISFLSETVTLYGETYQASGHSWRAFNKKNRHKTIEVTLPDDKLAQFLARAKTAGDRWKTKVENEIDAHARFPEFQIQL